MAMATDGRARHSARVLVQPVQRKHQELVPIGAARDFIAQQAHEGTAVVLAHAEEPQGPAGDLLVVKQGAAAQEKEADVQCRAEVVGISASDGVGPLTAAAIVAGVGDDSEFKNGRRLAAWLGLVPRQYSCRGRSKLCVISKRGDNYLPTLLINGTRAALRYVTGKTDARSRWLQQLMKRCGYNNAAVAVANRERAGDPSNTLESTSRPLRLSLVISAQMLPVH